MPSWLGLGYIPSKTQSTSAVPLRTQISTSANESLEYSFSLNDPKLEILPFQDYKIAKKLSFAFQLLSADF